MPRGHRYLSIYLSLLLARCWIHLCISHKPCLILSGHSSYSCVQLHSDRSLALLSSHLAPFFFSSPSPVFLSYLAGLWASFSISRISHSNHSQSFMPSPPPSLLSPAIPTHSLSRSFFFFFFASLAWDTARGVPWLYPRVI